MKILEGCLAVLSLIPLSFAVGGLDLPDALSQNLQGVDPSLMQAVASLLGPSFFDEVGKAAKCVQGDLEKFNFCNFNASYDPFYIIQACLQGTLLQQLVQNTLGNVDQPTVNTGIPPNVSDQRCFDLSQLTNLGVSTPLPVGSVPTGGLGDAAPTGGSPGLGL